MKNIITMVRIEDLDRVTMSQQRKGGKVTISSTNSGLCFTVSKDEANAMFLDLKKKGYVMEIDVNIKEIDGAQTPKGSEESEEKVFSPKKPKKTREESLTAKYGDKEHRRQYVEARKYFRRFWLNKGLKYGEMFDYTVKLSLNHWEAEGRPNLA